MQYEIKRGNGSLSLIRKPVFSGSLRRVFVLSLEYEDDRIEITVEADDFGKMQADEDHAVECIVDAKLNAPEEDGGT